MNLKWGGFNSKIRNRVFLCLGFRVCGEGCNVEGLGLNAGTLRDSEVFWWIGFCRDTGSKRHVWFGKGLSGFQVSRGHIIWVQIVYIASHLRILHTPPLISNIPSSSLLCYADA